MDKTIYDVAVKLIGHIRPIGETNADTMRLDNLETAIYLVDRLISDISQVREDKNRPEHSISEAGKVAHNFLNSLEDHLDNG